MPLFLAYCPDYPDNLAKRLAVRETHLKRAKEDKKNGISEFGSAFLPPPGSLIHSSPLLKDGTPAMAGSVMMFRLGSLEEAWKRVRDDVYWTEGVWDREKVIVQEFIGST